MQLHYSRKPILGPLKHRRGSSLEFFLQFEETPGTLPLSTDQKQERTKRSRVACDFSGTMEVLDDKVGTGHDVSRNKLIEETCPRAKDLDVLHVEGLVRDLDGSEALRRLAPVHLHDCDDEGDTSRALEYSSELHPVKCVYSPVTLDASVKARRTERSSIVDVVCFERSIGCHDFSDLSTHTSTSPSVEIQESSKCDRHHQENDQEYSSRRDAPRSFQKDVRTGALGSIIDSKRTTPRETVPTSIKAPISIAYPTCISNLAERTALMSQTSIWNF
jgi:hypothetical protein